MTRRQKITAGLAVGAVGATLVVPSLAGGHATVSPMQPQGTPLTAARTSYVLRVPNERPDVNTWKVRLSVPKPVQTAISVKRVPGWDTKFRTKDTGEKDDHGEPVVAIKRIIWTAKSKKDEVAPHFFEEYPIRFQNPATEERLCFPTLQYYRKNDRSRNGEVVRWTGPGGSDTPASCVEVKAAPEEPAA
jgi:uncharacterized protein YcnI